MAAGLLPGLQAIALPGVVHYHILLLALIALCVGFVARSWRGGTGWAFLAGLAGGGAIWLTPETMPFILMAYAALFQRWLQTPIGAALLACAAGFIDITGFALAIDPPEGGYGVPEIDRFSVVYVVLGLLLLCGALALWRMRQWRSRRPAGLALMAALLLAWIVCFPKVALGPYGVMNAADRKMFFGAITELQPVRSLPALTALILPGLVALLYLAWRAAAGQASWVWTYAAICAVIILVLAVRYILFTEFPAGLAAALLPVMLSQAAIRLRAAPSAATAARLALLVLLLLAPRLPLLAASPAAAATAVAPSCDLLHINRLLAPYSGKTVLADAEDTPELLYRTGIITVGSIYQHGLPGYLRARAAWRSIPGGTPPNLLSPEIHYILFCPRIGRYILVADLPPTTLWDALQSGKIPSWLSLQAQDPQTGWKLYRLR